MKLVINKCFGGFGLSQAGKEYYANLKKYDLEGDYNRDDPSLIKTVEDLGSEVAGDEYSQLEIVEIPDGVDWCIEEYDGLEHVAESHNTWG